MADYGTTTVETTTTTWETTTDQPTADDRDDHSDVKLMDEYHHGLCGCFDYVGNCLLVTFCCPIAACMASQRLAENFCYPVCFGALPLSVRFRSVARIEQGMCIEGCEWTFCTPCAMCRMLNEMDTRSFAMERN